MTRITCAGVVAAAVLATGCLQSSTLITVKADGSGTIEQQMLVGSDALTMMAAMGGGAATNPAEGLDEESMRKAGEKLGEGVRLVSYEPVARNGMKGARAVYAFDDINTLKVSQTPTLPGVGNDDVPGAEPEFTLKLERRGRGRVLTIATPEPEARAGEMPDEVPEMPDMPEMPPEAAGMMNMMKMMFQNLKMSVAVEVDGEIIRTNAKHRDGSRVTIVEVDFNELMKDEESWKAVQGKLGPGGLPSDMQATLMNLKGVKVNPDRVLTIEWR